MDYNIEDARDMKFTGSINENIVVGGYSGVFAPDYMQRFGRGNKGIVSDGKFFLYDMGDSKSLYRPVEGNYSLANYVTANPALAAYYWAGYDKEKCQFVTFSPKSNQFYYEEVIHYTFNGVSTANMKFVAGSDYGRVDYASPFRTAKKKFIFFSSGSLHFFELRLQREEEEVNGKVKAKLELEKNMSIADIGDEKSTCILAQNSSYWFIGTGNKIYRVYANGGTAELWYTLDRGTVKAMTIDSAEKILFVAASVSDNTKKSGDIWVIDATKKNKLIEPVYKDACKEPVSLIIK